MTFLQSETLYVVSLKEIVWGGLLIAITMGIHGFGMLFVLRVNHSLKHFMSAHKTLMSPLPVGEKCSTVRLEEKSLTVRLLLFYS